MSEVYLSPDAISGAVMSRLGVTVWADVTRGCQVVTPVVCELAGDSGENKSSLRNGPLLVLLSTTDSYAVRFPMALDSKMTSERKPSEDTCSGKQWTVLSSWNFSLKNLRVYFFPEQVSSDGFLPSTHPWRHGCSDEILVLRTWDNYFFSWADIFWWFSPGGHNFESSVIEKLTVTIRHGRWR